MSLSRPNQLSLLAVSMVSLNFKQSLTQIKLSLAGLQSTQMMSMQTLSVTQDGKKETFLQKSNATSSELKITYFSLLFL